MTSSCYKRSMTSATRQCTWKSTRRFRFFISFLSLLFLAGCGGGGGAPSARSLTVAYVETECHQGTQGVETLRQALRIRRGDNAPITLKELTLAPNGFPPGICALFGTTRLGRTSLVGDAFQRLGITADGSGVVFEVTDDFSFFAANKVVPPEEEGIFFVRADGSGLRSLGPASHDASFRLLVDFSSPIGFKGSIFPFFSFSPNGRSIAFSDIGPGPAGEDAIQIVTLDIADGTRQQVTHLPFARQPSQIPYTPTYNPIFLPDGTIRFSSFSDPLGLNRSGDYYYLIRPDGSLAEPPFVNLLGSQVVPTFQITGAQGATINFYQDGTPVNHIAPDFLDVISETFLLDGDNLLQLTNFGRVDTTPGPVSADRLRVFLTASVNDGDNPSENCQIFSVDRNGGDLRQLTHFRQGDHSAYGCSATALPPGCTVQDVGQDFETGTLVFYSSCDPLGTNPNGGQVFTMRPDGTELRQLTESRGVVTEPDGGVTVELPGPAVYAPY